MTGHCCECSQPTGIVIMAFTVGSSPARNLTLLAMILAAGVFCLRGADILTRPAPVTATGSQAERALTNLLEPVAGPGNIRVSLKRGEIDRYMVLLNGPRETSPETERLSHDISAILTAATDYDAASDTLTITSLPFAAGITPQPTQSDWLELGGLGLLLASLTLLLTLPGKARETVDDMSSPQPRPFARAEVETTLNDGASRDIRMAGQLAQQDPDRTARLIRQWMAPNKGDLS